MIAIRATSPTGHPHEHTPDEACACDGHHHSHARVQLVQTFIGLTFIINSFVVERLSAVDGNMGGYSAMIGAVILGFPIIRVALKDLRGGSLNTNVLVSLAVIALFSSEHYQEAGVVSFFMLLGQIIEMRTTEGALASIHLLIKLTPAKARRVTGGGEQEVAVHELAVGDIIRVRPGDNVAADGVIVSGRGSFNQANITGESLPVDKKPDDELFAGTINLTGVLDIRVIRAGENTTLGRVHELILAAEKTKLPILRIVDRYMGFYTPLILCIGGLVWAFTHDLSRVVSVFIVSCPCAFVLASPTAMVAALSAAARLGILIKNVGDIELAARINAFVFDKIGTLTTGRLAVSRLAPLGKATPAELLRIAASVEKYSNHPAAKALAQLADEVGVPLVETAVRRRPRPNRRTQIRAATEDVVGTVRPKLSAAIEAKVSGRIGQMLVVPGQLVKAGQRLVLLDAHEIQSRLDQAAAARQQAENDLKRDADLIQQKILSQSEFDSAQSKYRIAAAAEAEAKTMLDYTLILAPFDGVITRKLADVGDIAAPGRTLLQMENPDTLRLEADVPEALIGNVKLGDKLAVRIAAVAGEIEGTVAEMSPAADPNSRTYLVKLDLPGATGLRSGQFGRVAVPVGAASAIRVPTSAVIQRGQMELVFVVANGHAQLRLVKTGSRVGDEIELVSGLNSGEQIVTEGVSSLTDGQPVIVKP